MPRLFSTHIHSWRYSREHAALHHPIHDMPRRACKTERFFYLTWPRRARVLLHVCKNARLSIRSECGMPHFPLSPCRTSGHIEQSLTLLLRCMQHLEHKCLTLPCCLLPLHCCIKCPLEQITLPQQCLTLLAQEH